MEMQFQFQQQFQLLDEKEMEAVRFFIESLIQKRQKPIAKPPQKPRKKDFMKDWKTIPIQVDNLSISREEIYADDRF